MKKNFFTFILLAISISIVNVFSSCSKNHDEELEEIVPIVTKPSISISHKRTEKINLNYTFEVEFSCKGIEDLNKTEVIMYYGYTSKDDDMKYKQNASLMRAYGLPNPHYMVRIPTQKGKFFKFKGILYIDGKEVDTTSGSHRVQ